MIISAAQQKRSAGLTLIELVTAMVIASIAALGLGMGITSIVGFYQDDWVTKGARFWGYEAMDYVIEKIETSKKVDVRPYLANYDNLLINPKDGTQQLNIQGTEYGGLTVNGLSLLDYAEFPTEGTYQENGQRIIALERFLIHEIGETDEYDDVFNGRPYLKLVEKSLWVVDMVISVTTKFEGESSVEYLKFKRVAWAKDKYFKQ